jgi:peptidyl-prolyl cis-trans isomerase B (cyclophilin B)
MTVSSRHSTVSQTAICAAILTFALAFAFACSDSGTQTSPLTATNNEEARAAVADSAIEAIDQFIAAQNVDTSSSGWKTTLAKPPELTFDPSKSYFWVLKTNVGDIRIRFIPEEAPMHVSSAVYLTRLGFFDELTFHRVIPNFMAQGGDPLGTGRGSPGYRFDGEFGGKARHDRPGILSQANAGPGTDGSQFFITFVPTPHLDGKHTIYGELVDGADTLKELERRREPGSPHGNDPLIITSATIAVE